LAVRLGIANVDALARSLTAKQFMGWMAFEQLEPFEERRLDYIGASICATIANVNRGKGQKAYTLEDFLLKFDQQPKPRQTPEEQLAVLKLLAAIHSTDDGNTEPTPQQQAEDEALAAGMRDQIAKARAAMIGLEQEHT